MSAKPPVIGVGIADVSLRPVEPRDRDFLARLFATTRAEEMTLLSHWSEAERAAFLEQQFEAQRSHYQTHYPGARFDIVTWRTEDVGRFYVHPGEHELCLMDISLLPSFRNRGIGGALLSALQDEARAAGKPVSLHVVRANPARRLYLRHGFEETGADSVYIEMRWSPTSAATAAVTAAR